MTAEPPTQPPSQPNPARPAYPTTHPKPNSPVPPPRPTRSPTRVSSELNSWARRLAATLPPFTASEAESVGHLAAVIDSRCPVDKAA